jgi:hypothetical protein
MGTTSFFTAKLARDVMAVKKIRFKRDDVV